MAIGKKRCFFSLILTVLMVFMAPSVHGGVYNPQTFVLKNGLTCYLLENHRAPVATLMVFYKVGSIDEPRGKSGLAHYLEHLMFKGSPDSPQGRYDRVMERIGAEFNAQTSSDMTVYYSVFPSNRLEDVAQLEAGRMAGMTISPTYATPELSVILEERLMRIKNNPSGEFIQSLYALFFRHASVRLPVIGWEHEIKGYTPADAQTFYDHFYGPNNAILVMAGDISAADAQKMLDQYFAPISTRPINRPIALFEPDVAQESVRLERTSAHVGSPFFVRLYRAPTLKGGAPLKSIYALEILQSYLGESVTGILEKNLIERDRIASSIMVSYNGISRTAEAFVIAGEPALGRTVDDLDKAIDGEIQLFLAKGISDQDLKTVKKRLLAGLAFVKDNVLSGAQSLGTAVTCGLSVDDFDRWPEHIESVTADDVMAAAKDVFVTSYDFKGVLKPETTRNGTSPFKSLPPSPSMMNREVH